MLELFEILGWVLLASVKFIFAAIPLLAISTRFWIYDVLIVASGGCLGVFIFTFLGRFIAKQLSRYSLFQISYKNKRRFVKIKNGYGLIGVAFITPVTISIPVGCILSATIESNKWRVILLNCSSVVFWSLLLFGLKGLFRVEF